MPEMLTDESKEVLERHYGDTLRNRTISDMKFSDLSYPPEGAAIQFRSNSSATNLYHGESFGSSLPPPIPQARRTVASVSGNASQPKTRPSTARTETRNSNWSDSGSHVGPATLVDKLKRGAQPVLVDGVRLSDVSRASSAMGGTQYGGSSFSISSQPFQRYSTRNQPGDSSLNAQPIAFTMKTEYDQDKVEEFAEIESKDELPRSIPKSNAEFQVTGQGTYSYNGNVHQSYPLAT